MPDTDTTRRTNPRFPIGVDVWPVSAEAEGTSGYYGRDMAPELDGMREAGISLVRLYANWRLTEPQAGMHDGARLDRLAEVIAQASARAMSAIVVLFSADPTSRPASLAWGARRDVRSDSYMLDRASAFATAVAGRMRSVDGLFGWQLADEAFADGFADADTFASWTRRIEGAVRAADPVRPVAAGIDLESFARATRIDARYDVASLEFTTAHASRALTALVAPGPAFTLPTTRLRGFLVQAARRGTPVLSDALGPAGFELSPGEEASALRIELATSLVHGAAGALVRRWSTLKVAPREPYRLGDFEQPVGLTDASGRPKASCHELVHFATQITAVDLDGVELLPERLAVLVPATRFDGLPSLSSLTAPRACFAAWRLAREAQLPTTVVYEGDYLVESSGILAPSTTGLKAETWAQLRGFVDTGGTLVCSFGGGEVDPQLRELFGLEFLGDDGARTRLEVRVAQPDVLPHVPSFESRIDLAAYARVSPTDATVVATDARGNPLVTVNRFGQGTAVFLAAPLEAAIGSVDGRTVAPEIVGFARAVIGWAGRCAGCSAPLRADDPDIEVGVLQGGAADVAVVVNHADAECSTNITSARPIIDISGVASSTATAVGGTAFALTLPPGGVALLRVRYR